MLTITKSTITGNIAHDTGGGINNATGTAAKLVIVSSTFEDNSASTAPQIST